LRDRVKEAITGTASPTTEVAAEVESSIETLVLAAADSAADRIVAEWRALPGGHALLAAGDDDLERSSAGLRRALVENVRGWQSFVLDMVAAEGASKRAAGRALSFGVNFIGVSLMVVTFAHTGGLSGAEVAVAGGTAALSQKLLEALFGDQAVRTLTARARADLLARIDALLDKELARYQQLISALLPDAGVAEDLRASARAVGEART
jgi:hypothetical protein